MLVVEIHNAYVSTSVSNLRHDVRDLSLAEGEFQQLKICSDNQRSLIFRSSRTYILNNALAVSLFVTANKCGTEEAEYFLLILRDS